MPKSLFSKIKNSIILCNKETGVNIVEPNCFKFVCEAKGSFGCFLGMTDVLKKFFIDNIKSYKMTYGNNKTLKESHIIELFEYLQKENIYIKIFNSEYTYTKEIKSNSQFKKFFGKDLINSYTTFTSYNNLSGFYIRFNENINIVLHDKTLSEFGMIIYDKFGTDLLSIPNNTFDYKKFIDNIYPIMLKLHKNNKYHGDIKPANIVYNSDSLNDIKYKLIDYDFNGNNRTPNFILPYVLQINFFDLYSNVYINWESYKFVKTNPELNLFNISNDIIEEFMSDLKNVDKLLEQFNIDDEETYLNIKCDDYAVALVLFYSFKDKNNDIAPQLLLTPEYKDLYEIIQELLSVKPYFLNKHNNETIAQFFKRTKKTNSFGAEFGGKVKEIKTTVKHKVNN